MIRFISYSREKAKMIQSIITYIHAFISIYAHQNLGIPLENIMGIFKYEGGIEINRREIVIYRDCVRDDFSNDIAPSKEEEAVCKAIEKILKEINLQDDNTLEDSLLNMYHKLSDNERDKFQQFLSNPFRGDPLRMFSKEY